MTNADRFLTAYSKIERYLRQVTAADKGASFVSLVTKVARKDAAVRRYEMDLLEFADLRNAIVHERTDGRAIAEPYERTVAELEVIAATLLNPPQLVPLF